MDADLLSQSEPSFKIEERIKYHKYLLTLKCIKQEAPSYLSKKLSYVSEINPYAVRNATIGNLNVLKQKNPELFKKSFAYSAPFLWNSLTTSVHKSNNTNVFKTNIKNYIFDSSNHQGSVSFIILFISHFLFITFLIYFSSMLLC